MVAFEGVLCVDVWDIVCDVWQQCLLQCFAITERNEIGLYDVPIYMALLGFGIGMMFASFYLYEG